MHHVLAVCLANREPQSRLLRDGVLTVVQRVVDHNVRTQHDRCGRVGVHVGTDQVEEPAMSRYLLVERRAVLVSRDSGRSRRVGDGGEQCAITGRVGLELRPLQIGVFFVVLRAGNTTLAGQTEGVGYTRDERLWKPGVDVKSITERRARVTYGCTSTISIRALAGSYLADGKGRCDAERAG